MELIKHGMHALSEMNPQSENKYVMVLEFCLVHLEGLVQHDDIVLNKRTFLQCPCFVRFRFEYWPNNPRASEASPRKNFFNDVYKRKNA